MLKFADGSYQTVDTPDQFQIAQAVVTYQGGHIYEVSSDEAVALQAAGYTVEEV